MTSDDLDDFTIRLLEYVLAEKGHEVNSMYRQALSELSSGEVSKSTADDLRAALHGLDDALAFYDEAANPHYDEEVHR